jgi:predicted membrane protein
VAGPSAAGTDWHVSPVGGLRKYGPWRMDRHVVVVSIVGGTSPDLSQAELTAPEVTLTKVSVVGGVRVVVPAGIRVEVSGFSLVGGTRVEGGPEPGPGAPTVHIRAFSVVGGVRVRRGGPGSGP